MLTFWKSIYSSRFHSARDCIGFEKANPENLVSEDLTSWRQLAEMAVEEPVPLLCRICSLLPVIQNVALPGSYSFVCSGQSPSSSEYSDTARDRLLAVSAFLDCKVEDLASGPILATSVDYLTFKLFYANFKCFVLPSDRLFDCDLQLVWGLVSSGTDPHIVFDVADALV